MKFGIKSNLPSVGRTSNYSQFVTRDSSIERRKNMSENRLPEMGFKELAKAVQHDSGKKVVMTLGLVEDSEGIVTKKSKPIVYR